MLAILVLVSYKPVSYKKKRVFHKQYVKDLFGVLKLVSPSNSSPSIRVGPLCMS